MVTPIVAVSRGDRDRLRREMRARRRSLSLRQRSDATIAFAHVINRARLLRPGMRVAVYFAHGHEADLAAVIDLAHQRHCALYLPAITDYRRSRMAFVKFDPARSHTTSTLRPNHYGIPEPHPHSAGKIPVGHLDLILLPLVAFDDRGWRLGSGAGFYDRCLHHLRASRRWRRPRLIGIAYEFQRAARIEPEPWDVPLDGIVTERNLHSFTHGGR